MQNQRTLAELKLMGDKAFADAKEVIDTARQIALDCKEMNAATQRTLARSKGRQGAAS